MVKLKIATLNTNGSNKKWNRISADINKENITIVQQINLALKKEKDQFIKLCEKQKKYILSKGSVKFKSRVSVVFSAIF